MSAPEFESALRESEARLRQMVNVGGVGVMVFDVASGALIDANDAFLDMTGYTRAQIEQRALAWRALTPEEYVAATEAAIAQLDRTGRAGPYEKQYFHADGSRSWMLAVAALSADGKIIEYCIDISDRKRAEAASRDTQRRLEDALATAKMAYWNWNLATDEIVGSPSMSEVFGLRPGQTIDSSAYRFTLLHPEDRERHRALVQAASDRGRGWDAEFRIVRPRDGTVAWLEERATVTRNEASGVVQTTGLVWDVSDRKRAEAAVERENVERDRLALRRRLAQAEEEERRRLARELHDEVGQHLTALGLGLQALSDVAPPHSEVDRRAAELRSAVGAMSQELHSVAVRLRPKVLDDFGLDAAIVSLAQEWSRRSGIGVDIHATVGVDRLPDAVVGAVYRIVQEALTNVSKHSGATSVGIVVERRDGHVVAIVEDNGRGFDLAAVTSEYARRLDGGLGLIGIHERAALLGGTVDVETSLGGTGTTLIVRIPSDAPVDGRPVTSRNR